MKTSRVQEIGGYFELELNDEAEYHYNAFALNSGRNAFEYILKVRDYKSIQLPFFTCDAMLEPLKKLNIPYSFYRIDENLNPIINFGELKDSEALVYTNYFGIKDNQISKIIKNHTKRIIIDNSQAFFSKPCIGIDTFYSARKFFGVADGGYVYSENSNEEYERDKSLGRMMHLLGRKDETAEKHYEKFKENENKLDNQPIRRMSLLTQNILKNVNYHKVAQLRKMNFQILAEKLDIKNLLSIQIEKDEVPLVYPLLVDDGEKLKKKLIQNKIFIPTYWPNVMEWSKRGSFEYYLTKNLLCLPIDQRYGKEEMEIIINLINDE